MERRRKWTIILIILVLASWSASRVLLDSYVMGLDRLLEAQAAANGYPVWEPECKPNYAYTWHVGGMYAPLSEQTWDFRVEICTVGCDDRMGVRSTMIEVDSNRNTICHCDLNDCNPKGLPDWYY